MSEFIDKTKAKEEIVNDLLLIGFNKNDVRDIYKSFCDRYDLKQVEEGTKTREKLEKFRGKLRRY